MSIPDTFYTIDIVFCALVLLFGGIGVWRGFSEELSRLLSISFLLFGFCFLYPPVTQMAVQKWDAIPGGLIQIILGLFFFFSSMGIFLLLRVLFKRFLKEVLHPVTDKVIGMLSGFLFGMLIGVSMLSLMTMIPHEGLYQSLSKKSLVGGWVCETLTPWLHPKMMELPIFDQEEN